MDGMGIYGTTLFYALSAAFFGMALLSFLFCLWKGRLDYDEEPKIKMLEEDI